MKPATALSAALILTALVSQAKAEEILLSCVLSSPDLPRQDLIIKVSNGRIAYGSTMASLVDVETIDKGSLSIKDSHIAFKQTWSDTHVQWDWNIYRDSGDISIRYINTENRKQFLQKKGSCSNG